MGIEFISSDAPGKWRQDAISRLHPLALGANWGAVTPLVLRSGAQFRAPVPPRLTSAAYTTALTKQRLGGDGIVTPTGTHREQTQIGIFWAYDGTPSLCAPPRLATTRLLFKLPKKTYR
jgi:hypothetical protein